MADLIARNWDAYQLIDSGDGDKLERIGDYVVQRPCPQAIWTKQLAQKQWSKAQSICHRNKDGGGYWEHPKKQEPSFQVAWPIAECYLKFDVRFTSFGHCGIFFEQTAVWALLYERCQSLAQALGRPPKLVNLFGYTGCASLVMAAAGAEVYHVDSAKGVLSWGKQNAALNEWMSGSVKWIHDDIRSFLAFSQKRGFSYDGVLVDPPSWGHGSKKQKWDFNDDIAALMQSIIDVIDNNHGFCFLTSHTHGVQHQALKNLFYTHDFSNVVCGEIAVAHHADERLLPAGIYALASY